ncbi:MAG: STM3941 family protein [Bacteroidota bacterium]
MTLEEKILYPSKVKSSMLVIISLIFTLGGAFMIAAGDTIGWLVSGFFGICLVVAIVGMFPKANYLKLHKSGFELCSLFRKTKYQWEDVHMFKVKKMYVNTMVMFNFSEQFQQHITMRKVNTKLSGSEGALPDTYGLTAKELASLLNTYQQTYTNN